MNDTFDKICGLYTTGGRGAVRHGCSEGLATVWQRLDYERGALDARVAFDGEGRISGFFLVPPQQATPCPGVAPGEHAREVRR